MNSEEFRKLREAAARRNKVIFANLRDESKTCTMQGEYVASETGDKWIQFKGVVYGDEHFFKAKEDSNEEDNWKDFEQLDMVVGQTYRFWIWGSWGEDHWEFGHETFTEISDNGRLLDAYETLGLDMAQLRVKWKTGYGRWLTNSVSELPGTVIIAELGCPSAPAPGPDPGPTPPAPDPEPDPVPPPPPPPPIDRPVDPKPPSFNGGAGTCPEGGSNPGNKNCGTTTVLSRHSDGFWTHNWDRSTIRSVVVLNPSDAQNLILRVMFNPDTCDINELANSACLCTSNAAGGAPVTEITQPLTVTIVNETTLDCQVKGWVVQEHDYENGHGPGGERPARSWTRDPKGWLRDPCQLQGFLQHGGVFTNYIEFYGADGHVVHFNLPKGGYHFGPDVEPLRGGQRYEYKLFSDCKSSDGSISSECGWDQRTEDDGRTLACEDEIGNPGSINYRDLLVTLDPGYGTWNITGPDTGYIDVPELCGEPEPPNYKKCPPGTKPSEDGETCQWQEVEKTFIPECIQFSCCSPPENCGDGPDGSIDIGDGDGDGLGDCDKRPAPNPVPGSNDKNQTYLYDRLNHTYIFCCPIKADVTWLLPFDTLPPVFQRYITTTASVRVSAQLINNPQLFQLLKDRENILRMECMNYELEQADLNFLNQPDHSTYMSYQTMQTLNR